MGHHEVRALESRDFEAVMQLEQAIFGARGEPVLGPCYVRLCCDFNRETCFVALDGVRPVGYVLCFVEEEHALVTTLGLVPGLEAARLAHDLLLGALVRAIGPRVDACWFPVEADRIAAVTLLAAHRTGDRFTCHGPATERRIGGTDRAALERLRARYERPGHVPRGLERPGAIHVAAGGRC